MPNVTYFMQQAAGSLTVDLCAGAKWLLFHTAILLLPYTQCLYLILGATSLYIPIMGRSGAGNNAELIVALLIGAKFGLLSTCVVCVMHKHLHCKSSKFSLIWERKVLK